MGLADPMTAMICALGVKFFTMFSVIKGIEPLIQMRSKGPPCSQPSDASPDKQVIFWYCACKFSLIVCVISGSGSTVITCLNRVDRMAVTNPWPEPISRAVTLEGRLIACISNLHLIGGFMGYKIT